MLRTMRNNLKSLSWVLWLVILTFVGFAFVEWGTGGMSLKGSKNAVLIVGNETLTANQFQKELAQAIENYRRRLKDKFNKSLIQQLQLPEQLLQQSINQIIVQKEARRLKIHASDDELRHRIVNSPGFQRNGRFIGVKAYENLLAYNRIDVKEFERELRDEIVRDKFETLLSAGLAIAPDRLKRLYHQEMDSVELDVVRMAPDRIREKIPAPEAEVQAFYKTNRDSFKSPERRSGTVIVYHFDDFKSQVKVSERECFAYFKKNRERFKTPASTRVSRILLKYGEDNRKTVLQEAQTLADSLTIDNFAATAKNRSQDDKAAEGGDWGLSGWRSFSEQEQRIIDHLGSGGISTPVDTGAAFAILMVTEKKPESVKTFEEVSKGIREMIETRKVNELVREKLADLYNRVKDSKDLAAECRSKGITCLQTDPLTNGEPLKKAEDMGVISRRLFTLETGETAFPVEFAKGIAVVQLNRVDAPKVQPFEAVRDEVRQKYVDARRLRLLRDRAESLVKALNAAGNEAAVKDILKKRNLEMEAVSYKRGNRLAGMALKRGLDERIFSLSTGQFADPIVYEEAVMVVRPTSINVMNDTDFQNSRTAFYQRKLSELENRIVATFIYKKREDYKIRFNQQLFDKVKTAALSRLN